MIYSDFMIYLIFIRGEIFFFIATKLKWDFFFFIATKLKWDFFSLLWLNWNGIFFLYSDWTKINW